MRAIDLKHGGGNVETVSLHQQLVRFCIRWTRVYRHIVDVDDGGYRQQSILEKNKIKEETFERYRRPYHIAPRWRWQSALSLLSQGLWRISNGRGLAKTRARQDTTD